MTPRSEPPIRIHRRRDRDGLPINDRRLARAIAAGECVRVAAGSFVAAADWRQVAPMDRHLVRVIEVVDRARGPVLLSHHAAAAIWGIDRVGSWPLLVDTTVPRTTGGRSSGEFRRRTLTAAPALPVVPWRGHLVTSPAQTAVDLAREGTLTHGVIAMDQALWQRRPGGALTREADLRACIDAASSRRGGARAGRAGQLATGLADSVRESESRVLIERLGFPAPVLQQRFALPGGRVAYTDFWWPDHDHAGEFDGVGKYLDPHLLAGRTPEQALIEEKDRGDALRRQVGALSRWRVPALVDPRILYDILTGDGLPSAGPRPPRGLVLR